MTLWPLWARRHMPQGPCQGVKGGLLEPPRCWELDKPCQGQGSEETLRPRLRQDVPLLTHRGWAVTACGEGRTSLSLGEAGYLCDRAPVPLLTPPLWSNQGAELGWKVSCSRRETRAHHGTQGRPGPCPRRADCVWGLRECPTLTHEGRTQRLRDVCMHVRTCAKRLSLLIAPSCLSALPTQGAVPPLRVDCMGAFFGVWSTHPLALPTHPCLPLPILLFLYRCVCLAPHR